MNQQTKSMAGKSFFKMPFEQKTFRLSKDTLNSHSEFRRPERPYFRITVRKINYRNEFLTLGVKIQEEAEECVYIQVQEKEILVSCTVDTNETFLSRYAYFALTELMSISESYNFEKFYWPDFFDQNTGKSKYLDIINDRLGLDVTLKPKYPNFYKPGFQLVEITEEPKTESRKATALRVLDQTPTTSYAVSYCLADTNLNSFHSNHFPFLVPYLGTQTKNKESIKSYSSFLSGENDMQLLSCTPIQEELNEISFKMRELAPLKSSHFGKTEIFSEEEEEKNGRFLFELWQEALNLIISQKHLRYNFTHGMYNIKGKPNRNSMLKCEIGAETPHLLFRKVDKKAYFQFELRFKVQGKTYVPNKKNTAFFINARIAPQKFFLLDNYTDYQVTSFFANHRFTIAVLKSHFKDEFRHFVERLAERYEIKES